MITIEELELIVERESNRDKLWLFAIDMSPEIYKIYLKNPTQLYLIREFQEMIRDKEEQLEKAETLVSSILKNYRMSRFKYIEKE